MATRDTHRIRLERIDDYRWRVPLGSQQGMLTEGRVYASERMLQDSLSEGELNQVANVACLPGIVGFSMAMPDIHFGYGFPIGGVAATDVDEGVISPGGVGYDINCGVRLVRTDLMFDDIQPAVGRLLYQIARDVPAGVGSEVHEKLARSDLEKIAVQGARWAVDRGYGRRADLEVTEEGGCLPGADPGAVSARAAERGLKQLGTLGSGNHFLEIQVVEEIYDVTAATAMGIHSPGQVTVLIHTGSRGYGYQICDDSLEYMQDAVTRYGVRLPDRQLACAPLDSPEAHQYLSAMACAANFAWANRQMIQHRVREAFQRVLGRSSEDLGMAQVYDVAHNIAKIERHEVNGEPRDLCVHRKGATRAFAPGVDGVPECYQAVGQPVLVPGDMGSCSYVLVGTDLAMRETWGSTCHGAGRVMSRHAALRTRTANDIARELELRGILVTAASKRSIVEEQPDAYKDVSQVVDIVHGAGISRRVAKMRPVAVAKG